MAKFDTLQAKLVFAGVIVTTVGGIVVAWIQYGREGKTLSGAKLGAYVKDEHGGVNYAEVKWYASAPPLTTRTDRYGYFDLKTSKTDDTARLEINAIGYETYDHTLTLQQGMNPDILLTHKAPQANDSAPLNHATTNQDEHIHPSPSPKSLGLSDGMVTPIIAAPTHNYFLDSKSPRMWFDEAKYYRRSDKDAPSEQLAKETPKLVFARRYFSADSAKASPVGRGWHHPYESYIDVAKSTLSKIIFRDESQHVTEFLLSHDVALILPELSRFFTAASKNTPLADLLKADEQAPDSYFLPTIKNMNYMGVNIEGGAQLSFQHEFIVIRMVDNTVYLFDHHGRMRQITAPGEPAIELRYDAVRQERLTRVTTITGASHFIDIQYDANDLIASIVYDDGSIFSYRYDQQAELTLVKTQEKQLYQYGYDPLGRLTTVNMSTEEQLQIDYNEVGWRVALRRGMDKLEWRIEDSPELKRIATKRSSADSLTKTIAYSFDESTQALTVSKEGEAPATYHVSRCGCKPLDITRNGVTTHYIYDELGRLVKQESPVRTKAYTYDAGNGKVASATEFDASNHIESHVIFTYDSHGNLLNAQKEGGKITRLEYDAQDRVALLEDNEHNQIEFTYNDRSKPITIHVKGIGVINVTYKQGNVEIDKVEGKAEGTNAGTDNGREISAVITTAFEELLELIMVADTHVDTEYAHVRDTI